MPETIVFGLSGPSSSGKTTVALNLIKLFPRTVPDAHIPINPKTKDQDWDCPEAFDMDAMVSAIQSARRQLEGKGSIEFRTSYASQWANPAADVDRMLPTEALNALRNMVLQKLHISSAEEMPFSLVLVDGILLFYDDFDESSTPGAECDAGVFICAQYKTLKQRREARSGYVTKEGIWNDPPGYFDNVVWPNFVKYHCKLIAANPEAEGGKHASASLGHFGNVAICSSDAPFAHTLEACVESIINQWNCRQ
ncbi:ribosylnicotinamide kinase [Coemansia sp. RSA 990]|nr:ribosylnicotinamide kinase [Coemansia sp. RSA 990]